MNWTYGVSILSEGGESVITVRDLPEVCSSGNSLAEALELAADAVDFVVAWRIRRDVDIPQPTPVAPHEYAIPLEPRLAAKASIYALWKAAGITKTELARRLGRNEAEVRRILDPDHGTKLDQLQEAAMALGARLVVGTVPLAA